MMNEDQAQGEFIDALPFIVCILLVVSGVVHLSDPLRAYGLSISFLLKCPWKILFCVWLVAFTIGRLFNILILRFILNFRLLVVSGKVNPGGVYMMLKDSTRLCRITLGFSFILSQVFMEEFFFRGLLLSFVKWLLSYSQLSIGLTNILGAIVSSFIFGLIHFIPIFCYMGRGDIRVSVYALIMPLTLGLVFCILNERLNSLWPGWIIHFGLNYATFICNDVFGTWEKYGL